MTNNWGLINAHVRANFRCRRKCGEFTRDHRLVSVTHYVSNEGKEMMVEGEIKE